MKIKVYTTELEKGMYVSELDRPWLGTPFLFQGFRIDTREEIEQLQELCHYVYVDGEKSSTSPARLLKVRMEFPESPAAGKPGVSNGRLDPSADRSIQATYRRLQASLREANEIRQNTRSYVDHMLEDARLGKSVDTGEAREIVGRLVENVVENPDALVWLTHLKKRDEYTAIHCVNVCVLSLTFGRCMGLDTDALTTMGLGALLHDLGKMRVPPDVLNKPGRLTDEEFKVMKAHPELGHLLIKSSREVPDVAKEIVLRHHERLGGGGYPGGLKGGQLHKLTKMVSIVDVYDAVTSDRVYHDGIAPSSALKNLYNWAPNNFELPLVEGFIKCIGIYPVGSIVELTTGDIGVVVASNEEQRLRPLVMLVLDPDKQPHGQQRLINLASPVWQETEDSPRIRAVLEPGAHGIDVRAVLQNEIRDAKQALATET